MLTSLALALLSVTSGLPAPGLGPRPVQDGFDPEALGRAFATYLEAREGARPLDGVRADLERELAASARALGCDDVLARPAELGRALRIARTPALGKAKPGKVEREVFHGGSFESGGLEYAFRLPRSYDATSARYPLILSLPDEGETPASHLRTHWNHRELLEGAILFVPAMPDDQRVWSRVMVDGRPGGLVHVLTGLRVALERFAIDDDRIFVAGRGKAVPAAVAAGNHSPQRFAGILGRAGDVGETGPENFSSLPTWFAGAGARAAGFREAARAAGHDNCALAPGGSEADAWGWISSRTRATHPGDVTVMPGDPFPTRAYWLRIAPTASDARVRAVLEREDNHIRIEGAGASQAILYLSDDLLDLDRPVRVTAAHVEREVRVERRLATTLDLFVDGTSDAGCVYTAELVVDLTEPPTDAAEPVSGALIEEYETRLSKALGRVEALWSLHAWCLEQGLAQVAQRPLRHLLRLEPDHARARAALDHVRAGDVWFESRAALDRWQASQEPAAAEACGRVDHKGTWIHPDLRALAAKGATLDPNTGLWTTRAEAKRVAQGWFRQDLEWIAPAGARHADDGLWRVEGEWLPLEQANRRHARIDSMWRIPGGEILLHATADRDVALRALAEMRRALEDLRRVYGVEPALPLSVAVLRDEEQYDRFAFGAPDGSRPATHLGRLQVVHSAFLAESWFEPVEGEPAFRGMGVCYWDPLVPGGDLYGVHSARLAAGLSYVDAIDPSPKAVRRATSKGVGAEHYEQYFAEKSLPMWLRYGGPVYAERFFRDERASAAGNPDWARAWSRENLAARGGLRGLEQVLAFELDPDHPDEGLRLYIEAGLVVAFMLDGGCAPVEAAHAELKRALVSGRLHPNDVKALSEALLAHEAELRAFAGV